jgi:hypothetical protein
MKNIFYVYVYLDPRKPGNYVYGEYEFDYEPFYVGKGNNGRAYVHLTEGSLNNNENKLFTNKIKKIQRTCGCNPIIVKHREMLFENMSFELEIDMIKNIGRKDLKRGPLCNLTNGGDGCSGKIYTLETKKKISDTEKKFYILNPDKAKYISIRQKERFKNMSEFDRKMFKEKHKEIMSSDDVRDKLRKKAIERYSDVNERKKISIGIKNYHKSHPEYQIPEACSFKNKKHLDETKEKMSNIKKGENNPFYGKKHSDETKKKMSESRKGKLRLNIGQIINIFYLKEYCNMSYNKIAIKNGHSFNTVKRICNDENIPSMVKQWLKDGKQSEWEVDVDELKNLLRNKGVGV